MSFIGNPLVSQAFVTDSFSGNGSTTAFTMSVAPATTAAVLVAISGVVQDPSTYSIVGTTLTFSQAPPSATANISTRYLGIPSTGVTSTAYRTVTEFTATAAQTTFTPPSFTPGFVNVYRNGVLLGSADYVASSGTTVVLNAAATLGDLVTVESFLVSSILNAVAQTNGSSVNQTLSTPTITTPTISNPIISGNVGIGTNSPATTLDVANSNSGITLTNTAVSNKRWRLGGSSAGAFQITETGISDRLTINTSGYVGIGISNPSSALHVTGSNTYAGSGLLLGSAGVASGYIWTTDNLYIMPNATQGTESGSVVIQNYSQANKFKLNTQSGLFSLVANDSGTYVGQINTDIMAMWRSADQLGYKTDASDGGSVAYTFYGNGVLVDTSVGSHNWDIGQIYLLAGTYMIVLNWRPSTTQHGWTVYGSNSNGHSISLISNTSYSYWSYYTTASAPSISKDLGYSIMYRSTPVSVSAGTYKISMNTQPYNNGGYKYYVESAWLIKVA